MVGVVTLLAVVLKSAGLLVNSRRGRHGHSLS